MQGPVNLFLPLRALNHVIVNQNGKAGNRVTLIIGNITKQEIMLLQFGLGNFEDFTFM